MQRIRTLYHDTRGNVLMLTGLSILFLFAVAGAGVDFGRQQLVRMKLQNASDAAAVAAASMPSSVSAEQRRAVALRYYNLNFPTSYLGIPRPAPSIQIGNQIIVDASTSFDANFVSNVGVTRLESQGRTVVDRSEAAASIYDVILVMDNSQSMATPTTAPTFVASDTADNARNLGILRCRAEIDPYMRQSWCPYYRGQGVPMGDGSRRNYANTGKCQQDGAQDYCERVGYGANIRNGTPYYYRGFAVREETRLNALRAVALNFVSRIIEDGNPGSRVGTVAWADTVIAPQALTDDIGIIRRRIHDMSAWGGTNPYLAMNQANSMSSSFNAQHVKAVVLMSDGMPTQIGPINPGTGRDSGFCNGSEYCAASANGALTVCSQLKNNGVQVYTVGLLSSTDPDLTSAERQQAQNFLRNCASVDADGNPRFYTAQNGAELDQAFSQILGSLGRIRISQ